MTFILNIFKFLMNVIYLFFKLFKTRNQITLISRQSNSITLDFKLLSNELEKELPDYKVVALCKKVDNKFLYIFHMFKQMYHISRSRMVILDSYSIAVSNLKHKKDLKIIQIWHALGIVKKAGCAIIGQFEGRSESVSKVLNMHKNYDYVFTTSEDARKYMALVFDVDINKVYNVPLPRVDLLKDKKYIDSKRKEIFNKYSMLKDKKNVLYAPTYRKDEREMQKNIDDMINLFPFEKYNLIIKLHPLSEIEIKSDKVIKIDDYSTLSVMMVSDIVISDYSSMIYEAGILKIPQVFYAFDYSSYKDKRDFFIDYEKEVPGPICKDAKSLIKEINNIKFDNNRNREFVSKYVDISIDNYSSNMVDKIKKILDGDM